MVTRWSVLTALPGCTRALRAPSPAAAALSPSMHAQPHTSACCRHVAAQGDACLWCSCHLAEHAEQHSLAAQILP